MQSVLTFVFVLSCVTNEYVHSVKFLRIKNETKDSFKIEEIAKKNAYYFSSSNNVIDSGKSVVIQFCPKLNETEAGIDLLEK